ADGAGGGRGTAAAGGADGHEGGGACAGAVAGQAGGGQRGGGGLGREIGAGQDGQEWDGAAEGGGGRAGRRPRQLRRDEKGQARQQGILVGAALRDAGHAAQMRRGRRNLPQRRKGAKEDPQRRERVGQEEFFFLLPLSSLRIFLCDFAGGS